MTKQSKIALAPLSTDAAAKLASGLSKAVGALTTAQGKFDDTVAKLALDCGVKLTAAQYGKQVEPGVRKALKVRVAKGSLSESSVSGYLTRIRTGVLAAMWGIPRLAGEGVKEFTTRASLALAEARTDAGEPVYVKATGRPAKAKGITLARTGGPTGPATGSPSSGDNSPGGTNRSPQVAAALILSHQNEARAQRLVAIMESHAELFDRWASSILTDDDKAAVAKRSAKRAA